MTYQSEIPTGICPTVSYDDARKAAEVRIIGAYPLTIEGIDKMVRDVELLRGCRPTRGFVLGETVDEIIRLYIEQKRHFNMVVGDDGYNGIEISRVPVYINAFKARDPQPAFGYILFEMPDGRELAVRIG